VVTRLVEQDTDVEYVLYVDDETARDAVLPERAIQRRVRLAEPPSQAASAGSTRRLTDLFRLTSAVHADRPDVFLFTSVYTYFPVIGSPTVLGVHDAIVHELPGLTLATRRDRLAWRAKETLALRTAAAVFTVSETSRSALAARFGLPRERLRIVPEAADEIFAPRGAADVGAARSRVGLADDEPFYVFAGGVSPHKNVETLLHAYASLAGRRVDAPRLVVVGDLDRDPYLSAAGSVRGLVASLELEDAVLLPGFVDDETLACLYSGAAAVVIPSLAEGFGLPAVEGAACGAPMVLSDLPAHRETLDGCAEFFPPTDSSALAAKLEALLDDAEGARDLAERGHRRARTLTWDAAVPPLRDLLLETVAGRRRRR
jgi:glycosyltransferase involved in cell wall biosynthesis